MNPGLDFKPGFIQRHAIPRTPGKNAPMRSLPTFERERYWRSDFCGRANFFQVVIAGREDL